MLRNTLIWFTVFQDLGAVMAEDLSKAYKLRHILDCLGANVRDIVLSIDLHKLDDVLLSEPAYGVVLDVEVAVVMSHPPFLIKTH